MKAGTVSFVAAREFVRSLHLASAAEFFDWASGKKPELPPKPPGIPANPHQVYPEWISMSDWIGTGTVAVHRREFLPFEHARAFVRALGLSSTAEWKRYARGLIPSLGFRPEWIPACPDQTYDGIGWAGMRDWLGTGDRKRARKSAMRSFAESREFARSLRLKSWGEWRRYVLGELPRYPKKPSDVPAKPDVVYRRRGWISYGDFLGCDTQAWHQVEWRPFAEAREFARSLTLSGGKAWRRWVGSGAKPADIPANPDKVYAEWKSWPDWLSSSPTEHRLKGIHERLRRRGGG